MQSFTKFAFFFNLPCVLLFVFFFFFLLRMFFLSPFLPQSLFLISFAFHLLSHLRPSIVDLRKKKINYFAFHLPHHSSSTPHFEKVSSDEDGNHGTIWEEGRDGDRGETKLVTGEDWEVGRGGGDWLVERGWKVLGRGWARRKRDWESDSQKRGRRKKLGE